MQITFRCFNSNFILSKYKLRKYFIIEIYSLFVMILGLIKITYNYDLYLKTLNIVN